MVRRDFAADDFEFIRERIKELAAPAIVRPESLMPVVRVPLVADVTRYPVRIVHRYQDNLNPGAWYIAPPPKGSVVRLDDDGKWRDTSNSWLALPGNSGRPIASSVKLMTIEQIDRWNALRWRTGMKMEIIP